MKDDAGLWLKYAMENMAAAKLLLARKLYNPCLQNVQQSIEKALKALLLEKTRIFNISGSSPDRDFGPAAGFFF